MICSCSSRDESVNLEKTVLLSLLDEVDQLDLPEDADTKITSIEKTAADPNAKLSDLLTAISDLNEIKNSILTQPIIFIDAAAGIKIREALGMSANSTVTVNDILSVKELDLTYTEKDAAAGKQKIHYLTDLKKFPQLRKLILDGNELYSTDGLGDLTNLTYLSLSGCFSSETLKTDISIFTELSALEYLDISYNNIENITALGGLSALTSLDISGVKSADVFAVAGFAGLKNLGFKNLTADGKVFSQLLSLETLDISYSVFTGTPELSSLTSLKILTADGTTAITAEAVRQMTWLKGLSMSDCGLTADDFVAGLTSLSYLDLSGNALTDATPIYALSALTRLNLSGNCLTSFITDRLNSLMTLDLSCNSLTAVYLLGDHTALSKLCLSGNCITSLKADGASDLTELNISQNPISDPSAFVPFSEIKKIIADDTSFETLDLTGCTKLTQLSLRNVQLTSSEGLYGLTALQTFDAYGVPFKDISAFSYMGELRTLNVSLRGVEDVTPLAGLISLETLTASGMNNPDWESFNSMEKLKSVTVSCSYFKYVGIQNLPKLETLTVLECPYLYDTSKISGLPSLRELTIDGANIQKPIIKGLLALERLTLTNCDMEYPDGISDLPSLCYLDLSNNDFEALVFSSLPSLEYLDLSNGRIVTISDLNAAMNYGTLILKDNYVSDLSVLPKLYTAMLKLDISNNRIRNYKPLSGISIEEICADGNKAVYDPSVQ